MTIEIGSKPLKEISPDDLLKIVILEGACNVIEHNGVKIWNKPVITDFSNKLFSDTLVLDYNSYRVSDNMKSADYVFFFDFKRFSWHYSRDYEQTRKIDGDSKRVRIETIKFLISRGYDVPLYDI